MSEDCTIRLESSLSNKIKWLQINKYTFVNEISGDLWMNIESLYPPQFKNIIDMIFDDAEKAFVLDSIWALRDKDSSRNYFIQSYTERFGK